MPVILGAKNYLTLASEDQWGRNPAAASGTFSGTQELIHLPVDEYSVRFRPENRQSDPFTGIYQRKHNKNFRGFPQGTLRCPLYGFHDPNVGVSLAQYLMDWAFENHEATDLPSKTAQWAEGPGTADKEHNGLRVNSATISGSESSGFLEFSADLMGKTEVSPSETQSLPDDRNKLVDFEFFDVVCSLGGTAVNIDSFSLQVQHSLSTRYLNSYTPTLLFKTQRVVTLEITLVKDADTYDGYRRATSSTEFAGQLILKGLHNGTGPAGTYSQVTIDFDRLGFVDADDNQAREELTMQPVRMIALKPDTSNNEMRTAWTTA